MSYRSFKRVLGETHLERKFLGIFGLCLLLLIAGSFRLYLTQTEKLVSKQNPQKAELLVATSKIMVHWQGYDYRTDTKREDAMSEVIQHIAGELKGSEYEWRFLQPVPNPDKPAEPIDPYDQEVLEHFMRMAPPATAEEYASEPYRKERLISEGKRYEYFRPIYAQADCVKCHRLKTGSFDLAENDLMAVAKVTITNESNRKDQAWNRAILWTTAIVVGFVAMIAAYLTVRYVIVKPLKHLRDVSEAVSHGKLDRRAEIHTADEFEELGVAFNGMLRHLIEAQEELRRLNQSLDVKVDELAQVNMQLFELNRLKSDFMATMSHELRTPLNSIIGFSDVLGSIKSLDDKQRRYVQNIQKSGKMLLDMINDILDLAKIESGKMDVRPSEFPIERVIGAQCDMARPLTERKNIDLEIDVPEGLDELHQDQGKVQQILNNLLSNAIKFTPDGGRIVVAARRDSAGDLRLSVADTGVGIAHEDQAQIFEKFRQGNTVMPAGDAMTREYSGTGLGLSIVKELCKLLGGDISLQSELGKGSLFTVRLPWWIADARRATVDLDDSEGGLTSSPRDEFALPRSPP
ncbi:MAG TPA: ATP-binding protein [Pirellulales bacterium]|nr:ATP-binding protein [Pirellulales bacterium]